jgi:hypothetical protein
MSGERARVISEVAADGDRDDVFRESISRGPWDTGTEEKGVDPLSSGGPPQETHRREDHSTSVEYHSGARLAQTLKFQRRRS